MSLLSLHLIRKNLPLHAWRDYDTDDFKPRPETEDVVGRKYTPGEKSDKRVIDALYNALSNEKVIDLYVREWDSWDSVMRIKFTDACNTRQATSSVVKNIQRLDNRLGGKILVTKKTDKGSVTLNERIETNDGARRRQKTVSGSKRGAMQKYGIL